MNDCYPLAPPMGILIFGRALRNCRDARREIWWLELESVSPASQLEPRLLQVWQVSVSLKPKDTLFSQFRGQTAGEVHEAQVSGPHALLSL